MYHQRTNINLRNTDSVRPCKSSAGGGFGKIGTISFHICFIPDHIVCKLICKSRLNTYFIHFRDHVVRLLERHATRYKQCPVRHQYNTQIIVEHGPLSRFYRHISEYSCFYHPPTRRQTNQNVNQLQFKTITIRRQTTHLKSRRLRYRSVTQSTCWSSVRRSESRAVSSTFPRVRSSCALSAPERSRIATDKSKLRSRYAQPRASKGVSVNSSSSSKNSSQDTNSSMREKQSKSSQRTARKTETPNANPQQNCLRGEGGVGKAKVNDCPHRGRWPARNDSPSLLRGPTCPPLLCVCVYCCFTALRTHVLKFVFLQPTRTGTSPTTSAVHNARTP